MPQHENQVNFDQNTKIKYFSISTQNQANSDRETEIKSSSIPHTEIKSISTTHIKLVKFDLPHKNQVYFDPNTGVESISIPALKTSQFCMPSDGKNKLITIQTLNQVVFDPYPKPSQF